MSAQVERLVEAARAVVLTWRQDDPQYVRSSDLLDDFDVLEVALQPFLPEAAPRGDPLAAAAPDLLHALREAADFLEARFGNLHGHDWGDEDAATVADQIDAAIAKAEGR